MRELTLTEVEDVNGGNPIAPVLVGAAIVGGIGLGLAVVGFGAGMAVNYFFY